MKPLLAADQSRNEDELPDHADREGHDQRLGHWHVTIAGDPVGERGRYDPGEHSHRERGGSPDGEDPADPQLRNLDARDGGVGASIGCEWV